jgi:hypothetical protein
MSSRFCFGCGAEIMPPGPNAAPGELKTLRRKSGYWEDQKIQKKKSQLARLELCFRCESLRTGGAGAAQKVSTSDYDTFRKEVSVIRRLNAVVVLAVDAMHFESTLIPNLRDYVGGNPIVLAVTRCDLLPAFDRTDDELLKVRAYATPASTLENGVHSCL